MLEVHSALTGEPIAVLEDEEGAGDSVRVLKRRLAQKIGLTRFRLRLFEDNRPIDDNETISLKVVQLVILEFLPRDFEQEREVMMACQENDDKLLEEQLSQPRNPNFEDADGKTPFLYVASCHGSLKCVHLLIEAGAQIDQGLTHNGETIETPLHAAAGEGHIEVVRFLVESGANKDQRRPDDGATPLFVASEEGHIQVVRFLVESGANKDQGMTDDGETPLWVAAWKGHLEVVRFLVESGASKDQGKTNGETPLYQAARKGHVEVVRFLVESGACKDQGLPDDGETPLHVAVRKEHLKLSDFW